MAPVCQKSLDGNKETHRLNAKFGCFKKIKKEDTHIINRLSVIDVEIG